MSFALAVLTPLLMQQPLYVVQPYYLYPSDQPYHKEYKLASDKAMKEIQDWYKKQVGLTFEVLPTKTIKSAKTYAEMRGDSTENPLFHTDNKQKISWWNSVMDEVGGPKVKTVNMVFAQGGGGVALGTLTGEWQGMCTVGDWVLEPISGVSEPKAVPAKHATWEVKNGTPMGTLAHELGHAFGLHHPEFDDVKSVMKMHWEYPQAGLTSWEYMILWENPFFNPSARKNSKIQALFLPTPDKLQWGESFTLRGSGFTKESKVEFFGIATIEWKSFKNATVRRKVAKTEFVSNSSLRVTTPPINGSGYLVVWNGTERSNIVPVNIYPLP